MTPDRPLSAIRAALDDTERLAHAAAGRGGEFDWRAVGDEVLTADDMVVVSGRPTEHIARHDPAAVLRLVAAMREIVDLHHSEPASGFDADGWEHYGYGCAMCFADTHPCLTIHALARGLGIDPEETP